MSTAWVGVIAFAVGVIAGLEIAKAYAHSQVSSDVSSGLQKLGLPTSTANAIGDTAASAVVY